MVRSIMKTGPGRFQSSEIDERIVLQATLSLLGVQFGDFGTFPAWRMSLQKVSQVISRPASESRCQISLWDFPEHNAASISHKSERTRAVFVVGGSAASFSKALR